MKMRKYITLIISILWAFNLYSQENVFFTQQWYSRINHNPASAGSDDYDIFLIHRNQWTGFNKAPRTVMLNAHTSLDYANSALGISLAYDPEGPWRTTTVGKFVYSYRINIGYEAQLSFGLGADFQYRAIDYNLINVVDPNDPMLGVGKESRFTIGADFGLEFSTEALTIGASVTNLTKSVKKATTFSNAAQYYAYIHYKTPVSEKVSLSPTVSYMYSNNEHLIEAGLTGFLNEDFWLGAAYRVDNALCLFVGFRFYEMFRIGYSFDYHTNGAKNFGQTHEIMLSIRIPKPQRGLVRNRDGSYTASRNRVYKCR
jgi:type IX secretion system PorP/SprF family membrane protein